MLFWTIIRSNYIMSYKILKLAKDYRDSSEAVKKFVKISMTGQPIETKHCSICYDEGIVKWQSSDDDFDKDVCEHCENYDIRKAIKLINEIKKTFKKIRLKNKKKFK